jgi:type IV pilus biogenesis protein CpaD/CtpE
MKNSVFRSGLLLAASAWLLMACATPKKDEPEPKWDVATEAEVAKALDIAVAKAAKGYVQLKKDGVLMFCKRHRQIGSNLPTITCLTEAQLRVQVESMQKYRDDMRQRSGRCTLGPGCLSGGGPNAAGN